MHLIDKEYELLSQMIERVQTESAHNELLRRSICLGTSGRYGWLVVFEGDIKNRSLVNHDLVQRSCFIEQSISIVKLEVSDIVHLWEQLVAQKRDDTSYYLNEGLYSPIYHLLVDCGLSPAWTRIRAAERGSDSIIFHCHVSNHCHVFKKLVG